MFVCLFVSDKLVSLTVWPHAHEITYVVFSFLCIILSSVYLIYFYVSVCVCVCCLHWRINVFIHILKQRDPGHALLYNSLALTVCWEIPLWCKLQCENTPSATGSKSYECKILLFTDYQVASYCRCAEVADICYKEAAMADFDTEGNMVIVMAYDNVCM